MPKRSNLRQAVIFLAKKNQAPEGATVAESEMLADSESGEEREVDVVIRGDYGDTPILISVEVTGRKRPADQSWVDAMLGKHSKMPTGHLYLVSWSGFTAGALRKVSSQGGRVVAMTPEELPDAEVSQLWYEEVTPDAQTAAMVVRSQAGELVKVIDVPIDANLYVGPSHDEWLCTVKELINRLLNKDRGQELSAMAFHHPERENLTDFSLQLTKLDEQTTLYVHDPETGFLRVCEVEVVGPVNWSQQELEFTAVRLGDRVFAFSELKMAGSPALWVLSPNDDGSAKGSWKLL